MFRVVLACMLVVFSAGFTLAQTTLSTGVPAPFQFLPQGSPALFNGDQSYTIEVPSTAAGLLVRVVARRAESTLSFHLRRGTDVVFGVGGIEADVSVTESEDARVWTLNAETLAPGTYFIAISAGPYQEDLRGSVYATVLAAPESPAAELDVPGATQILLAGQPVGTELRTVASAPENSPVLVPISVQPGQRIRITANGTIDSTRLGNNIPPEGQLSNNDAPDEEFGLSGINGPRDALVGVFLGSVIDSQGTPPLLQFRGGGIEEASLEPLLQQTFYIGNGFTADGRQREFVVPAGATRLFLGTKSLFPRTITGSFHVSLAVDPAEVEPAGRNPLLVPAIAHLSLAGQPDGATSSFHTVPLNSPPRVAIALEAGQRLRFSVRGKIQHRLRGDLSPNGAGVNANAGLSNGFSGIVAPEGGVIGVFTADVVNPDTVPTRLTFNEELRSQTLLNPELQQMFYIGDGYTPGGERRTVVVPPGATRLYLATHDTVNYFDAGSFLVAVSVDDSGAPTVPGNGVVNGASFAAGPTAPGAIASIFGQNLAADTVVNEVVPLPLALGGVEVYFDNYPAAFYFVSPGQINVQVPWELKDRPQAWLTVVRDGIASNPIELEIAPFDGGIFDVPGVGPIVINNRTGRLVSAEEPARRGDALIVYATGLGPVAPGLGTGVPPPLTTLTHGTFGLEALLSGRTIPPLFVGGAPGFVGVIQVNFLVPDDIPSGSATLRFQSPGFGVTQEVSVPIE